jgi:hypothetical protein
MNSMNLEQFMKTKICSNSEIRKSVNELKEKCSDSPKELLEVFMNDLENLKCKNMKLRTDNASLKSLAIRIRLSQRLLDKKNK